MPDEQKPEIANRLNLPGGRLEVAALEGTKLDKAIDASRLRRAAPVVEHRQSVTAAPKQTLAAPSAPGHNPLNALPFPNPGDRIRADDFKSLSQSLLLVRDTFRLSGMLFGRAFAEAKLALEAQQYVIIRTMTVFGTEIDNLDNQSLNNRKVIQVLPLNLGEPEVVVVVTEAVETRRFAPNLIGLTYNEASERLKNVLGDITFPSRPMHMPDLEGLKLVEAQETLLAGS